MDGVPRGSTRDNGLRCANYAAIADLDPRVVDALLTTLRDAGIAAYAVPAPGTVGGAMETRMPSRPIDRLWVDDQQIGRARDIVAAEEHSEPVDIDAAWQQVLASLQTTSPAAVPPWPVSEDVDTAPGDVDAEGGDEPDGPADDAADNEHF